MKAWYILIFLLLAGCEVVGIEPIQEAEKVGGEEKAAVVQPTSTATATPTRTATPLPTATPTQVIPSQPTQTPTLTATPEATATPTVTQTPEESSVVELPGVMGPEEFPPGVNPLTGMLVSDPSLLDLPAVLISITNFPVSARPQAGLSFASHVFEVYIGEGQTRFLVVFYGDFPRVVIQPQDCPTKEMEFEGEGLLLGDFVWLDADADGVQDEGEEGVPDVCVQLFDSTSDELLASTGSDAMGYYQFSVEPDRKYFLRFLPPLIFSFTGRDLGPDDAKDSDADSNGYTRDFWLTEDQSRWDAGLVGGVGGTFVPSVGPVRSGRLPYGYIQARYPGSCLVYAGASQEIRMQVPACASVFGSDSDDINSAFMRVTDLQAVAESGKIPGMEFNYTGNMFSQQPPEDGDEARKVVMFYNYLNQTLWEYDPASGGYLRYNDLADGSGEFYPSRDRLTGEQLNYSNVVILFAEHNALTPTIIDISLQFTRGNALIFRDGKAYRAVWETINTEYEKETGRLRPVRFLDLEGNPFPLKPGQTWVHVVTLTTQAWQEAPGEWKVRFYAP